MVTRPALQLGKVRPKLIDPGLCLSDFFGPKAGLESIELGLGFGPQGLRFCQAFQQVEGLAVGVEQLGRKRPRTDPCRVGLDDAEHVVEVARSHAATA